MTEWESSNPVGSREHEVTVFVPEQPPVLNPAAARAMLRLLRRTAESTSGPDIEPDEDQTA